MSMIGLASKGMGREETALHAHRFLLRAGLVLGNVFGWIFIFDYFLFLSGSIARALVGTLIIYALSQSITIFVSPLAAAQLRRGIKTVLVWAVVVLATAYVVLGATLSGFFNEPNIWGMALFAACMGFYRALYFAPYEIERSEANKTVFRGRMFWEVLLALFPAFVGATFLMEPYAPLRLLFGAAALTGISVLPLFLLKNIHENFSFSYVGTFRQLFGLRIRRILGLSFLEGVQGAALFLLWPLAVFLILGFSYAILGIVLTITLLSLLLTKGLLHHYLLPLKEFSTPTQVVLAVSGWFGRLAAGTPIAIVVADVYAYTTRSDRGTLHDPFTFEQTADNASYIDEYTVLKEIALAMGRIACVVIAALLIILTPLVVAFGITFVIAAASAGASVIVARHRNTSLV